MNTSTTAIIALLLHLSRVIKPNNGNIIHQSGSILQDDNNLYPPENTFQEINNQPETVFQNKILREPAELNFQDNKIDQQNSVDRSIFVDESSLDYIYWNSELGNKSIPIEFNNEKKIINYWLQGKPLKVITHGWEGIDENDEGVISIKTAYVTVGDYNVITVDWSRVASNIIYPIPAYLTEDVGSLIAKMLENLVKLVVIDSSDIHLIGHSLGAHVFGACGAVFSLGKIGRITGLDPAGPGYELGPLQSARLDSTDAQFVDVIHTAGGTFGYLEPIGTADFYPNGGTSPQPGCLNSYSPSSIYNSFVCSHFRSFGFYTESVYHRNSFVSVKCGSWKEYTSGACKNNKKSSMGEDADPKANGIFYLKTNSARPYSIPDTVAS